MHRLDAPMSYRGSHTVSMVGLKSSHPVLPRPHHTFLFALHIAMLQTLQSQLTDVCGIVTDIWPGPVMYSPVSMNRSVYFQNLTEFYSMNTHRFSMQIIWNPPSKSRSSSSTAASWTSGSFNHRYNGRRRSQLYYLQCLRYGHASNLFARGQHRFWSVI